MVYRIPFKELNTSKVQKINKVLFFGIISRFVSASKHFVGIFSHFQHDEPSKRWCLASIHVEKQYPPGPYLSQLPNRLNGRAYGIVLRRVLNVDSFVSKRVVCTPQNQQQKPMKIGRAPKGRRSYSSHPIFRCKLLDSGTVTKNMLTTRQRFEFSCCFIFPTVPDHGWLRVI